MLERNILFSLFKKKGKLQHYANNMQFSCQNSKYGQTITTFITFDFHNKIISCFEVERFT